MPNTFPTDKDVYQITDTVIRQTDCQYSFGKDAATFIIKLAGDSAAIVNLAADYRQGTRVTVSTLKTKFSELSALDSSSLAASGKVTASTSTTKEGHAQASITVTVPYSKKVSPGGGGSDDPEERKVVTWNEKSTQYEFPLGIYAGEGASASQCNAGNFEAWKNERTKNIANYKNFQYELSGEVVSLEGHTLELAKKWYKGIEAVDRAYPEVNRVTNYYNLKSNTSADFDADLIDEIDEDPDLYYIDSTPDAVWGGKFPNYSWVKSAYDVDVQPTEYEKYWNVTVNEAWIGIPIDERGTWDEELYGADGTRWKFADITGQE